MKNYQSKKKVDQNIIKKAGFHLWLNSSGKLSLFYRSLIEEETPINFKSNCDINLNAGKIYL